MKKLIFIIIVILLTGCEKKETQIYYQTDYYNVATPYKHPVSTNYTVNNMTNYDISEIETSLMEISTQYFSKDNTYYQDGQYLDNQFLKENLNKENLNNYEKIIIDGVNIDPYYITGIVEQNYLDKDNNLKGISLGLILNPYQKYTNNYGTTLYKKIEEQKLLDIGLEITTKLIKKIREIQTLSKTKIIVGLYVCGNPATNENGSYKKYTLIENNNFEFKDYSEAKYYITSDYVIKNNNDVYLAFKDMEKELKSTLEKIHIIGICKYKGKEIKNINFNLSAVVLNKSEILILSQTIANQLEENFNKKSVTAYIKQNNDTKAIIDKKINAKANIHILEE